MKSTLIVFLGLALTACAWAQEVMIPAPQKRAETIEVASKLVELGPREFKTDQNNPFSMKGFEVTVAAAAAAETPEEAPSDHNLLAILADMIETRGRFVMNGEVLLLVGRNKLKVGSTVPVSYGGLVYELEISAIEPNQFTVRYKTEEFTRPIQKKTPSKKP